MNIEEILELMDDTLDKSMQVPFAGKKSLVDVEKLRDLVEEIRLNLPGEIKQAQKLVQDRKIIINDAKSEADSIIKRAEERATQLVSKQEITRLAQQKAQEIMSDAQNRSKELRFSANEYAEKLLVELEELFTKDLTDIKRTKNALRGKK